MDARHCDMTLTSVGDGTPWQIICRVIDWCISLEALSAINWMGGVGGWVQMRASWRIGKQVMNGKLETHQRVSGVFVPFR